MEFLTASLSLCLIFSAAVIIPAVWQYLLVKHKLKNIPSPKGLPLLGNVFQLGTSNSTFFQALCKWGNEFREKGCFVIYTGLKPVVVINNAKDSEIICCNNNQDSRGFDFIFRSWLKDGMIFSKGTKWAFRRKLLTPSFHFSILSKFLVVINEQAKQLTDKLCKMVDEGQVDIHQLVTLCSLDIACETLMGLKLRAQTGENTAYVNAIHGITNVLVKRMAKPWLWNDTVYRMSNLGKEEADCLKVLNGTTKQVICERKNELKDVKDVIMHDTSQDVRNRRRLAFLDLLIEAQRQNRSFTDDGIEEEVDAFLFAGHDTISSSTTFALYLIGRHPEVQRKIHEELDRVFGNDHERPVSQQDIQQLEYLNRVMKESLRLLPSAPIFLRQLTEDVNACGATIPKGTAILLSPFSLHRDPQQFPNPEKFDPDRFLPDNIKYRHNFAYLPFGAGPRICIGQKFALMEEKVILATILRKVSVTSLQSIDELGLTYGLVLRTINTMRVSFSLRQTN